jgi:hypothetical protein
MIAIVLPSSDRLEVKYAFKRLPCQAEELTKPRCLLVPRSIRNQAATAFPKYFRVVRGHLISSLPLKATAVTASNLCRDPVDFPPPEQLHLPDVAY